MSLHKSIDNPYSKGANWGIKEFEDGRLAVLNPNNVLRGVVTIDEGGAVGIEGPLAHEAERDHDTTIVDRVANLVALELEGRTN